MDARIQQSVVANLTSRPAPIESGPFVIGVDPATDNPGINYATPLPGAAITAANVSALVAAFREAGRQPRLEYVTGCAPGLEALLVAAGFTVEARHRYLVCRPGTAVRREPPPGFDLRTPATDRDRADMVHAQNRAFGGDPAPARADVDRVGRLQDRGGVAVMAVTDTGDCAGGGLAVPPNGAVSEVAGIAVRKPYRRRGLAGAITARITAGLFADGVEIAWLEASGEDSLRVYERVGYRPAGDRLYVGMSPMLG
jgi:ribosomal protein S18 acetylase RimI-like enzyme